MALPLSLPSALRLQASLIFVFMAASSVPSPLYALYRTEWGFSPATLTVVFAVYVFSLLAALLTLARLSDHLGRRPVILGAIALELVSVLLFLAADSVALLAAARLVQGAATGAALSVLGAGIADIDRQRAPLINSTAPLFGLGAGALGSSVLAAHAPAPTRLVYLILLLVLLAQGWRAWRLPETVRRQPGALRSMRPRLAIAPGSRRGFLRALPLDVAVWALGGYLLSLGPTLAHQVTGGHSPVVGGAMLALLTGSGAVASLLLRQRSARALMQLGAAALAAGVGLVLVSTVTASALAFFLGIAVAGVGFGVGFLAALRTAMADARAEQQAALMAAFLVLSYCAFSLPALAAGVAVTHFGLVATSQVYGALVMLLAVMAWIGSLGRAGQGAAARPAPVVNPP